MKKNKILKTLGLFGCAILLVAVSIAGTMAYMTSTAKVENTFTVGSVSITMDETKVDLYGNALTGDDAGRGNANTYKLIPGHTYVKDPTIHVTAGSEQCYLFVKVENAISAIEDASNTIAAQMAANGWTRIAADSNIWYYNKGNNPIVDARTSTSAVDVPVFANFIIATNATVSGYATSADKPENVISITAYAVQADGFDSAEAAWTAAFGA